MREGLECGLTRVKGWPGPTHFKKFGALFGGSVFTTSSLVVLFGTVEAARVLPLCISESNTLTEGDALQTRWNRIPLGLPS